MGFKEDIEKWEKTQAPCELTHRDGRIERTKVLKDLARGRSGDPWAPDVAGHSRITVKEKTWLRPWRVDLFFPDREALIRKDDDQLNVHAAWRNVFGTRAFNVGSQVGWHMVSAEESWRATAAEASNNNTAGRRSTPCGDFVVARRFDRNAMDRLKMSPDRQILARTVLLLGDCEGNNAGMAMLSSLTGAFINYHMYTGRTEEPAFDTLWEPLIELGASTINAGWLNKNIERSEAAALMNPAWKLLRWIHVAGCAIQEPESASPNNPDAKGAHACAVVLDELEGGSAKAYWAHTGGYLWAVSGEAGALNAAPLGMDDELTQSHPLMRPDSAPKGGSTAGATPPAWRHPIRYGEEPAAKAYILMTDGMFDTMDDPAGGRVTTLSSLTRHVQSAAIKSLNLHDFQSTPHFGRDLAERLSNGRADKAVADGDATVAILLREGSKPC